MSGAHVENTVLIVSRCTVPTAPHGVDARIADCCRVSCSGSGRRPQSPAPLPRPGQQVTLRNVSSESAAALDASHTASAEDVDSDVLVMHTGGRMSVLQRGGSVRRLFVLSNPSSWISKFYLLSHTRSGK